MTDNHRTTDVVERGEEEDVGAHLLEEGIALGLSTSAIFGGQAEAKVEPAPEGLSDPMVLVSNASQPTGQAKPAKKAKPANRQGRPKPPLEP